MLTPSPNRPPKNRVRTRTQSPQAPLAPLAFPYPKPLFKSYRDKTDRLAFHGVLRFVFSLTFALPSPPPRHHPQTEPLGSLPPPRAAHTNKGTRSTRGTKARCAQLCHLPPAHLFILAPPHDSVWSSSFPRKRQTHPCPKRVARIRYPNFP